MQMSNNDLPEFSAFDVNKLSGLARKSPYYMKAYIFVKQFLDGRVTINDKTRKWLFGVRKDLDSQEKDQ
jgi:hypothetical protein